MSFVVVAQCDYEATTHEFKTPLLQADKPVCMGLFFYLRSTKSIWPLYAQKHVD